MPSPPSPLIAAVESHSPSAVASLLSAGASPHARKRVSISCIVVSPDGSCTLRTATTPGESALALAILHRQPAIVRLLLAHGADPCAPVRLRIPNWTIGARVWTQREWDSARWWCTISFPNALSFALARHGSITTSTGAMSPYPDSDADLTLELNLPGPDVLIHHPYIRDAACTEFKIQFPPLRVLYDLIRHGGRMEKFETGVVVRCREWEEIEVQKVRDAREGREADGSGCAHAKKGEADVKGKKTVRDVGHVGNVNFGKGDSGTVGTAHAPSVSTPATTPARTAPARTESTADLAKPLPPTPTPTPLRSSSRHSRSTTIGVTPSHPSHPSLHRAASPAAEPVLVDPVEPRPMSAVADIVSGDPPPIVMGTDTDADPGVLAVPTSADAADHLSVPTSGELDNSSEEYFTDARASSSSPTNLSSVSIDAPSTIIAPLSHMSTVPPESHVYHRDPSTVPRRSFADIVPFESMSLPRGGEGV